MSFAPTKGLSSIDKASSARSTPATASGIRPVGNSEKRNSSSSSSSSSSKPARPRTALGYIATKVSADASEGGILGGRRSKVGPATKEAGGGRAGQAPGQPGGGAGAGAGGGGGGKGSDALAEALKMISKVKKENSVDAVGPLFPLSFHLLSSTLPPSLPFSDTPHSSQSSCCGKASLQNKTCKQKHKHKQNLSLSLSLSHTHTHTHSLQL